MSGALLHAPGSRHGRILRIASPRRTRVGKAVLVGLVVWMVCGSIVLAVNARREYVGQLGSAEWTPRATDVRAAPADRQKAAAMAAFEADVALKAGLWVRRSLGLGVILPGGIIGALWIRRPRHPPLNIGRSRRRGF